MDEAKSLVNMSVSAIFAALFLGAALSLLTICYMMWAYFSRQDAANQRMDYYSNLTAYDNQTIGGADVLSLLSHADDYGIFVIFLEDTDSGQAVFDSANSTAIHQTRYAYYDPEGQGAYSVVKQSQYSNAIPVCNSAINSVYSYMGSGTKTLHDHEVAGTVVNLHNKTKVDLIRLFTKSTADGLGSLTNGATDTYAAFKACLIYANDGTTDVSGVALVRANSAVTNFCMD